MVQVALDTSFLISFSDPNRKHHAIAVEYFRHCVAQKIPMWVSTVIAGEYHVKQAFTDLPISNFRILPYNLPHALRAGDLMKRRLNAPPGAKDNEVRTVVINDLKLLAQADHEKIPIVLSEDEATMSRMAERFRTAGEAMPHVLLLADGFSPTRLGNPAQSELAFPGSAKNEDASDQQAT